MVPQPAGNKCDFCKRNNPNLEHANDNDLLSMLLETGRDFGCYSVFCELCLVGMRAKFARRKENEQIAARKAKQRDHAINVQCFTAPIGSIGSNDETLPIGHTNFDLLEDIISFERFTTASQAAIPKHVSLPVNNKCDYCGTIAMFLEEMDGINMLQMMREKDLAFGLHSAFCLVCMGRIRAKLARREENAYRADKKAKKRAKQQIENQT